MLRQFREVVAVLLNAALVCPALCNTQEVFSLQDLWVFASLLNSWEQRTSFLMLGQLLTQYSKSF